MNATPDRLLIVNADDYGLTEGVSRTILDAHRDGLVTSTSLLALGPAFARTVAWLDDAPELGRGLHLAAVGEDPPLLSATEIPTLVDRRGALHLSWRTFLPAAAAGRIDPEDLRREFTAQAEAVAAAGVHPDHVDTHQNLHLWPMVRDVVLSVGATFGVRTIRATRSRARGPVGVVVRTLGRGFARTVDEAGWVTPDASTGLDEAGGLDEVSMVAALGRLAADGGRSAELAVHPGPDPLDDPALARYRWGYAWPAEAAALRAPAVRDAVAAHGFRLATFADLAAAR